MLHPTRLHGFTLLAAALVLAQPGLAQAQSLVDRVNDLETLGDGSVREIFSVAPGWERFFDRFSLIEFSFPGAEARPTASSSRSRTTTAVPTPRTSGWTARSILYCAMVA